ncbi:MAG: hypothetical protein GYB65_22765, partial [Chloroflexi bacterium]|nr:hypothetical protein [Chloroflexota bacterium]
MTPPHALLIEPTASHTFILYSQCVMLLEAGYEVTVIMSERQSDPVFMESLRDRINRVWLDKHLRYRMLLRLLREHGRKPYAFTLFNTFTPSTRLLLLALVWPQPLRFILHHAKPVAEARALLNRFQRLVYQLIMRRASRIYVLSPQVYAHCQNELPPWIVRKLSCFVPSYYPDYANTAAKPTPTDDDRVVFALPGAVDFRVRNYQSLTDALPRLAASPLADRIQIEIMGDFFTPTSRTFIVTAARAGLLGTTIRLQREPFAPFPDFAHKYNASHFLLPLIDSTVMNYRPYNRFVSPSSIMMSRGFALPLVCSREFDLDNDLRPFSVWYEGQDLFQGLEAAVELADSPRYAELQQQYRQHNQH